MKKIFMKVTMHFLTGSVMWPAAREINLGPCAHLHHQQFALVVFTIFLPFGNRGFQSKSTYYIKLTVLLIYTLQVEYFCSELFMLFLNFH